MLTPPWKYDLSTSKNLDGRFQSHVLDIMGLRLGLVPRRECLDCLRLLLVSAFMWVRSRTRAIVAFLTSSVAESERHQLSVLCSESGTVRVYIVTEPRAPEERADGISSGSRLQPQHSHYCRICLASCICSSILTYPHSHIATWISFDSCYGQLLWERVGEW